MNKGSPGQQELRFRKIGNGVDQQPTTYTGSHRVFWDIFYVAANSLIPIVDPRLAAVLSPISGDPMWQIQHRNDINYDSLISLRLAEDFDRLFSKPSFPSSLPGVLITQFQILETLLELVYSYANQFNLNTDAFNSFRNLGNRGDKIRKMIYKAKSPGLVRKTKKAMFT